MLAALLREAPQGSPLESPSAREAGVRIPQPSPCQPLVTTADSGEGAEAQHKSQRTEEAGKLTPESGRKQLKNSCSKKNFFLK